ncbi:hypothetical protein D3C78_1331110 [compost metagenome]
MQLVGGDEFGAIGAGGHQFFRPAAALGAQADLDDAVHVRHFGGAADGAGQTVAHAVDVVAPVQVGVDVHQRDRTLLVQAAQDGGGDAVVAAQHDGHGAGGGDAAHGGFGALIVFAARFGQVGDDVAAVDEADVVAALQQRAVDVEVVVPGAAHDAIGGLADGGGRVCLVVAEVGGGIGRPVGHAQDRDVGLEVVQVQRQRRIQQGRVAGAGRDGIGAHVLVSFGG